MDQYLNYNLIIIPIVILYNKLNKKKDLKFPDKWSSINTIEETKETFVKYNNFKSISMRTGKINNLTVIDVDNVESWNKLEIDYPPEGVKVETNNGFHLYYTYEPSLKTRSNVIEGIDIRNDGGNAILPPSSYEVNDGICEYTFMNDSIETAISKMKNLPKMPESLIKLFNKNIKPNTIRIELPNSEKIHKVRKALDRISSRYYNNYGNVKNLAYALVNYTSKINLPMKTVYMEYCKKGNIYEDECNKLWDNSNIDNTIGFTYLNNILRNYKLSNLETDTFDKEILIGLLLKKKDCVIDYMNRHFGIITSNDNGKALYCELEYKNNRIINIILISSKENFISKIPDSIKIEYIEDKYKSINKYWLESSDRNEYRKTVFEPGLECYGNLNMFLGFNYLYNKSYKYDQSKLKYVFKHLQEVICDNNEETCEYLLN